MRSTKRHSSRSSGRRSEQDKIHSVRIFLKAALETRIFHAGNPEQAADKRHVVCRPIRVGHKTGLGGKELAFEQQVMKMWEVTFKIGGELKDPSVLKLKSKLLNEYCPVLIGGAL
jgi:hypothetical protein